MDKEAQKSVGVVPATLDEIWSGSDFITLHTPLNDATRNLVSAATLAKCKKGVFIINAARGGIVNESDLLAALNSGQVKGAALDVYSQEPPPPSSAPLLQHPAVLCTPHLGASTEEAQKRVAAEIAEQMCDAFKGTAYFGCVNAPHLALAAEPALAPYVSLAKSLGALLGQVVFPGTPGGARPVKGSSLRVILSGPALAHPGSSQLVKVAVLTGMLPVLPFSELEPSDVNLVNSPSLAEAAGITLENTGVPQPSASSNSAMTYENVIRVCLTPPGGKGERVAEGSIINGSPRVTQLDFWKNFPPFEPRGHVLVYNNLDQPGQVSRVTTVLSDYHVNIASLNVARQYAGGGSPALSVLLCDSRIPSRAVEEITSLEGVSGVSVASFPDAISPA